MVKSMTSNTPWSVKGINPETREMVKLQARVAGVTMGEWLSNAIENASHDEEDRREVYQN